MVATAKFVPLSSTFSELLRQGLTSRPTLSLGAPPQQQQSNDYGCLLLGRNSTTLIADPRVSRRMAKVRWLWPSGSTEPPQLVIQLHGSGSVHVNGMPITVEHTPLNDADIISLGVQNVFYEYRVQIENELQAAASSQSEAKQAAPTYASHSSVPTPSPAICSSSPPPPPPPPTVDISKEFECPVCLDIIVSATTAVPCGHSFCQACLPQGTGECPSCRTALQSKPFPSRSLDCAIALLMQGQSHLFSHDDVQQYNIRTKQTKTHRWDFENLPPNKKFKGLSAADAIVIE